MDSMAKPSVIESRQEPIGAVALCLAIMLIVLPAEGDLLWILYRKGFVWLDRGLWGGVFLVLLTLVTFSWRRIHRNPASWHGRFINVLTVCILALNILQALLALRYHAL